MRELADGIRRKLYNAAGPVYMHDFPAQASCTPPMFAKPLILTVAFTLAFCASAGADLFVSSFNQHSVRRYSESDGTFLGTFIAASAGGLNTPHRGLFGPDGHFYVASAGNDSILRYNGHTGAFMDVFIQNGAKGLPAGTLDYPVDLTFGPDGNLYVSSQLNDSILRFNPTTGQFLSVFVAAGAGGLDGPSGIQFHNGDLFVAGRFSSAAYRYDGASGAFELTIGTGVLSNAFGLDIGADGNLYVASGGNSQVFRFNPSTGASLGAFVTNGSGGLSAPIGIEFGGDSNLYVASFNTDSVKRYHGSTGAYLNDFVAPAASGGLDMPNYFTIAVPEPGTTALLSFGALLFGRRFRRSARCTFPWQP